MAGPAAVVVAGLITLAYAIGSADGLVADDYFKRGKEVNRDLTRDEEARRLGLAATLAADARNGVAVTLEAPYTPKRLELAFAHATRAGQDRQLVLRRDAHGDYAAALPHLPAGKWHVTLTDTTRRWRLSGVVHSGPGGRLLVRLAPHDR
jgi:hypothetical protein